MTTTAASGTPAEPTTQPQAGTSSASAPPAGTDPSSSNDSEPLSLEGAKKLRQEHNALRKRVAEYEAAAKAAEEASLSELQKTAKRAEAAEASLTSMRSRISSSDLKLAAQAAGIIDPDLAPALLGAKVEFDAEGEPKNIAELVEALKSDKPHLFAAVAGQQQPIVRPASSGGATNPGAGGVQPGAAGGSGATITRSSFLAMSQQERITRSREVDAILTRYGGRLPD